MSLLRYATLGAALGDLARGVRETSTNWGDDVERYLRNAGINLPAAWCAAFVQYEADAAAKGLGVRNPLDDVKREALVLDYAAWADGIGGLRAVPVDYGDLALFAFAAPERWNHIGLVVRPPKGLAAGDEFLSVEGNTDDAGGREGIKVAIRTRKVVPGRVRFVRWA